MSSEASPVKKTYLPHLLAVAGALAVLISLYLNHRILQIYSRSSEIHRQWTIKRAQCLELSRLAAAVNAPAKSIFQTRDVGTALTQTNDALLAFNNHVSLLKGGLQTEGSPAHPLLDDLADISDAMADVRLEAEQIFSDFSRKKPLQAGERMPALDRKFSQVNVLLARLTSNADVVQKKLLDEQAAAAVFLQRLGYASLFLVLLPLGAAFYAYRRRRTSVSSSGAERRGGRGPHQDAPFLDSIVENIPHMIFVKEANELRFVRFNKAGENLLGYSREDLLGKNDHDFFPKQEADFFTKKDREVLDSKNPTEIPEEAIHTRYKGMRVLHTRKVPLVDKEGRPQYLLGISVDITERKQLERQLAAQYAVSRVLTESSSFTEATNNLIQIICKNLGWELGGIWRVDRDADVLRCVDIWRSPELAAEEFVRESRWTTFPPGIGLLGRVWANAKPLWIPDITKDTGFKRASLAASAGLRAAVAFPITSGKEITGVMDFFSREARPPDEIQLQMVDSLGGQIGQFLESKRAEEALRENEERYRRLFENAIDAIIVFDAETRRFEDANQAALSLLGYSREDFLVLKVDDISQEREKTRAVVQQLLQGQINFIRIPSRILIKKDGTIFSGEISLGAFLSHGRKKVIAAIRDISERIRVQQTLQKVQAEMEEKVAERTAQLRQANLKLQDELKKFKHEK